MNPREIYNQAPSKRDAFLKKYRPTWTAEELQLWFKIVDLHNNVFTTLFAVLEREAVAVETAYINIVIAAGKDPHESTTNNICFEANIIYAKRALTMYKFTKLFIKTLQKKTGLKGPKVPKLKALQAMTTELSTFILDTMNSQAMDKVLLNGVKKIFEVSPAALLDLSTVDFWSAYSICYEKMATSQGPHEKHLREKIKQDTGISFDDLSEELRAFTI